VSHVKGGLEVPRNHEFFIKGSSLKGSLNQALEGHPTKPVADDEALT
jgi:hypothetical protein